jgi:translation initiation factor 2 subunit 1
MAIAEPERFWTALADCNNQAFIDDETRAELMSNIVRRLTPQKVKIRADVEVACFAYEGVDAVRAALQAGELFATPEFPLKIRLVAPPLYVMQMQCLDRQRGIDLIQSAIDKVDEVIRGKGGQVAVKLKPKVVSDVNERELDALMKRSEMENAEVSGDEDESE